VIDPKELQAQAQAIGSQLSATVPEGVGFAILFYNKGIGSGAAGFAANAKTEEERREVLRLLKEFGHHFDPDRVIVTS
jgi:hypothetical protein